ncbi:alpha/beta fold hydrolase [Sphingomonas solaris]|uniref:Alpha/beta hydrolase n=1 Tax=Alterirhizorhabdus solaris TaxID=2529389 RepID=A0A558QXB8_9SPHN|nr:alpha/beta hydrolase [Sphingomonas solaris]TVV71707.1 alpha/beta hydrolase [Sphingomonas solaris]
MIELIEDTARDVRIEVLVEGAGPDIVLVPSAMRGAADFADLQAALGTAGYRSLAINPRGSGRSGGTLDGLTLRDIADDIAMVAGRLCDGPVHLLGHALGNVCVRAAASFRPEIARSLMLMPPGGHNLGRYPVRPEVVAAMGRCHDRTLPRAERLAALRTAFFAPGNDPSVWLDGWWPASAGIASAMGRSDPQDWWRGGAGPVLILMPLDDAMVSPEAGRATAAALGARVTYREIAACGHAILPEQPDLVAHHVTAFLDAQEGRR